MAALSAGRPGQDLFRGFIRQRPVGDHYQPPLARLAFQQASAQGERFLHPAGGIGDAQSGEFVAQLPAVARKSRDDFRAAVHREKGHRSARRRPCGEIVRGLHRIPENPPFPRLHPRPDIEHHHRVPGRRAARLRPGQCQEDGEQNEQLHQQGQGMTQPPEKLPVGFALQHPLPEKQGGNLHRPAARTL